MSDILHNCGHITHLMKIICTFKVFSAQCIRLFDRLSVIGVFNHFSCSKKALQPNVVAGLERTGCAHCAAWSRVSRALRRLPHCDVRDSAPCAQGLR